MAARVKSRKPSQTNRESDKIIVRLSEGMRARIAEMAASNGRSMTAEVNAALDAHIANNDEVQKLWGKVDRLGEKFDIVIERLEQQEELLQYLAKGTRTSRS